MHLKELIPEHVRMRLYLVFALVALGLGATTVGFAEAGVAAPLAVSVANAVFLYVAAAFGWTAATHTRTPPAQHRE